VFIASFGAINDGDNDRRLTTNNLFSISISDLFVHYRKVLPGMTACFFWPSLWPDYHC